MKVGLIELFSTHTIDLGSNFTDNGLVTSFITFSSFQRTDEESSIKIYTSLLSIMRKILILDLLLKLLVLSSQLRWTIAQKNNNRNKNGNDIFNDQLPMEELRFNKFFFTSSVNPRGFKPLKKEDYPINGITNSTLRLSDAYSVVALDDYEVTYNVPRLIEKIGGLPSYPEEDENAPFWELVSSYNRIVYFRFIQVVTYTFIMHS